MLATVKAILSIISLVKLSALPFNCLNAMLHSMLRKVKLDNLLWEPNMSKTRGIPCTIDEIDESPMTSV